jgi:hypothetical protein
MGYTELGREKSSSCLPLSTIGVNLVSGAPVSYCSLWDFIKTMITSFSYLYVVPQYLLSLLSSLHHLLQHSLLRLKPHSIYHLHLSFHAASSPTIVTSLVRLGSLSSPKISTSLPQPTAHCPPPQQLPVPPPLFPVSTPLTGQTLLVPLFTNVSNSAWPLCVNIRPG